MKTKTMLAKPDVKYIQSLGQKKFRETEGVFVAEGPKIIEELFNTPGLRPVKIYALSQWFNEATSMRTSLPASDLIEIRESELERISFLSSPNKVLAIFRMPQFQDISIDDKISIALDGIQDPGNLGTIVRIADWFGIRQVVCSPDCADIFNPKTVQSTMGSIGRVKVLYRDLIEFIRSLPELPLYAATLDGDNLYKMNRISAGLILVGNESKGISEKVLSLAERRITIPGSGTAESLNAAVATGIILSHIIPG
jgi:RNA methyltransferase, TrmH family